MKIRIKKKEDLKTFLLREEVYQSIMSYMSVEDRENESFQTSSGMKHGRNESTILFNIFLFFVQRQILQNVPKSFKYSVLHPK